MAHYDLELDKELPIDLGVLVATWKDGSREWRTSFDDVAPEALTWSPYPNGPNIGGAILHMASCDQYWIMQIAEGIEVPADDRAWAYDCTMDQYVPHWPTPPARPLEWYLDLLDSTRDRMVDLIKAHLDSNSIHPRGQNTMTYRWIIAHAVQHDSYHGGQIVLLNELYKKSADRAD